MYQIGYTSDNPAEPSKRDSFAHREARRPRFSQSRSNRRHATPTDHCRSAVGIVPSQTKCHDMVALLKPLKPITRDRSLRHYAECRKLTVCLIASNDNFGQTQIVSAAVWHKVSDTSRQFDERCEKPGERDSHKAVPIAATPHRLIAAEMPLELPPPQQHEYRDFSIYDYQLSHTFIKPHTILCTIKADINIVKAMIVFRFFDRHV